MPCLRSLSLASSSLAQLVQLAGGPQGSTHPPPRWWAYKHMRHLAFSVDSEGQTQGCVRTASTVLAEPELLQMFFMAGRTAKRALTTIRWRILKHSVHQLPGPGWVLLMKGALRLGKSKKKSSQQKSGCLFLFCFVFV